eukprot:CAMPEP_0119016022 /NCGR_PEP_ID=MMETSP1176-20130426/11775_1 /TAXON_ID=265551 /ORGANISM="Synedropsis recta cf, Strain CCMP1620" /LENGTH=917 /DNA_ID=CAMNT_0006969347 /DNA_START=47 /DNA_END=2800 /DNA_ORIENTATION=+
MPVVTQKDGDEIEITDHSAVTQKKDRKHQQMEITEHTSGTTESFDKTNTKKTPGFSEKWTNAINWIRAPILKGIHKITHVSAVHPMSMIIGAVLFAIFILVLGLFTNFSVDVDEDVLWTPRGSNPVKHMNWIDDESGFPSDTRNFVMVFHQDSATDILGQDQVSRIFSALDAVRTLPDYKKVCSSSPGGDCPISGVSKFWNNTAGIFQSTVASDEEAIAAMSVLTYPDDGTPVSDNDIFGNAIRDATGLLQSAQSYTLVIDFPEDDEDANESPAENFESDALHAILDLDKQWEAESGNAFRVEVIATRSFPDEFERAIINDIPLLPIVFVIMGLFTSAIFFKRDKVRSRSLLGFTAVISVLLSIMAGYGLMFVCAVPFTSMTQILPFVFFGVGLDDAFIITGSFFRLDPTSKDAVERVREMIDDIGMSIFLTTLTSSLAFGLGCISSIPAIFWLCIYAVPTMVFILLFQLTFFVSCMVLDDRRIQKGNRDCFRCCSRSKVDNESVQEESMADRFMGWYAEKLLRPWVKAFVIVAFVALAAACAVSTSKLEQSFKFTDVLPNDSYITDFFDAFNDYSVRSSVVPFAYFRYVDQSDESIQDEMEQYVNDLVGIDAIVDQPQSFWLRDFRSFTENKTDSDFTAQLDAFLADPVFTELYSDHIVRDDSGAITSSRVLIHMDNVDIEEVTEQVDALEDQRAVSEAAQVNQGHDDFRFFTYEGTYNIWAFYAVSADEILLTTVSSVAAVTGVTLLLVPHWTAALFVLPLISVLYVDLLGVMQWAGISINPISYIALVMSVGLLVDFILHVLLRFYESHGNRKEKVISMLKTMGSSILIGGITTFLGTLPLAFSSSSIFHTIFITFLALVILGASHGLILLPVILSLIGPEEHVGAYSAGATKATPGEETKGEVELQDDTAYTA